MASRDAANNFGVHSILVLEQLYAHGYVEIRIKSIQVTPVESFAGHKFSGHAP